MVDRNLFLRVISAFFILLVSLISVYFGEITFYILMVTIVVLSAFEWESITEGTKAMYPLAFLIIVLPNASIIYIYNMEHGLIILSWLVLNVWAIDIASYFVGKNIGGWRLCPLISPKKTWSGLVGGVMASLVVTLLMSVIFGMFSVLNAIAIGTTFAIIEQLGDLSESCIKRLCKTKDSGNIIPGHGGILDRVDGFIFTAPLVVFYIKSLSRMFQ